MAASTGAVLGRLSGCAKYQTCSGLRRQTGRAARRVFQVEVSNRPRAMPRPVLSPHAKPVISCRNPSAAPAKIAANVTGALSDSTEKAEMP